MKYCKLDGKDTTILIIELLINHFLTSNYTKTQATFKINIYQPFEKTLLHGDGQIMFSYLIGRKHNRI